MEYFGERQESRAIYFTYKNLEHLPVFPFIINQLKAILSTRLPPNHEPYLAIRYRQSTPENEDFFCCCRSFLCHNRLSGPDDRKPKMALQH